MCANAQAYIDIYICVSIHVHSSLRISTSVFVCKVHTDTSSSNTLGSFWPSPYSENPSQRAKGLAPSILNIYTHLLNH